MSVNVAHRRTPGSGGKSDGDSTAAAADSGDVKEYGHPGSPYDQPGQRGFLKMLFPRTEERRSSSSLVGVEVTDDDRYGLAPQRRKSGMGNAEYQTSNPAPEAVYNFHRDPFSSSSRRGSEHPSGGAGTPLPLSGRSNPLVSNGVSPRVQTTGVHGVEGEEGGVDFMTRVEEVEKRIYEQIEVHRELNRALDDCDTLQEEARQRREVDRQARYTAMVTPLSTTEVAAADQPHAVRPICQQQGPTQASPSPMRTATVISGGTKTAGSTQTATTATTTEAGPRSTPSGVVIINEAAAKLEDDKPKPYFKRLPRPLSPRATNTVRRTSETPLKNTGERQLSMRDGSTNLTESGAYSMTFEPSMTTASASGMVVEDDDIVRMGESEDESSVGFKQPSSTARSGESGSLARYSFGERGAASVLSDGSGSWVRDSYRDASSYVTSHSSSEVESFQSSGRSSSIYTASTTDGSGSRRGGGGRGELARLIRELRFVTQQAAENLIHGGGDEYAEGGEKKSRDTTRLAGIAAGHHAGSHRQGSSVGSDLRKMKELVTFLQQDLRQLESKRVSAIATKKLAKQADGIMRARRKIRGGKPLKDAVDEVEEEMYVDGVSLLASADASASRQRRARGRGGEISSDDEYMIDETEGMAVVDDDEVGEDIIDDFEDDFDAFEDEDLDEVEDAFDDEGLYSTSRGRGGGGVDGSDLASELTMDESLLLHAHQSALRIVRRVTDRSPAHDFGSPHSIQTEDSLSPSPRRGRGGEAGRRKQYGGGHSSDSSVHSSLSDISGRDTPTGGGRFGRRSSMVRTTRRAYDGGSAARATSSRSPEPQTVRPTSYSPVHSNSSLSSIADERWASRSSTSSFRSSTDTHRRRRPHHHHSSSHSSRSSRRRRRSSSSSSRSYRGYHSSANASTVSTDISGGSDADRRRVGPRKKAATAGVRDVDAGSRSHTGGGFRATADQVIDEFESSGDLAGPESLDPGSTVFTTSSSELDESGTAGSSSHYRRRHHGGSRAKGSADSSSDYSDNLFAGDPAAAARLEAIERRQEEKGLKKLAKRQRRMMRNITIPSFKQFCDPYASGPSVSGYSSLEGDAFTVAQVEAQLERDRATTTTTTDGYRAAAEPNPLQQRLAVEDVRKYDVNEELAESIAMFNTNTVAATSASSTAAAHIQPTAGEGEEEDHSAFEHSQERMRRSGSEVFEQASLMMKPLPLTQQQKEKPSKKKEKKATTGKAVMRSSGSSSGSGSSVSDEEVVPPSSATDDTDTTSDDVWADTPPDANIAEVDRPTTFGFSSASSATSPTTTSASRRGGGDKPAGAISSSDVATLRGVPATATTAVAAEMLADTMSLSPQPDDELFLMANWKAAAIANMDAVFIGGPSVSTSSVPPSRGSVVAPVAGSSAGVGVDRQQQQQRGEVAQQQRAAVMPEADAELEALRAAEAEAAARQRACWARLEKVTYSFATSALHQPQPAAAAVLVADDLSGEQLEHHPKPKGSSSSSDILRSAEDDIANQQQKQGGGGGGEDNPHDEGSESSSSSSSSSYSFSRSTDFSFTSSMTDSFDRANTSTNSELSRDNPLAAGSESDGSEDYYAREKPLGVPAATTARTEGVKQRSVTPSAVAAPVVVVMQSSSSSPSSGSSSPQHPAATSTVTTTSGDRRSGAVDFPSLITTSAAASASPERSSRTTATDVLVAGGGGGMRRGDSVSSGGSSSESSLFSDELERPIRAGDGWM